MKNVRTDAPAGLGRGRKALIIGFTTTIASIAIVLGGVSYLRSRGAPPQKPVPSLPVQRGSFLAGDILQPAAGEPETYLEIGGNIALVPGHYIIAVPAFMRKPVSVSSLVHPSQYKSKRFFFYKYRGDEPPFSQDGFWLSQSLMQELGYGRNFSIAAGDLLYVWVDEGGDFVANFGQFVPHERPRGPADALCGDGIPEGREMCDDGNNEDGDGCSGFCELESECGNGELERGEDCDDGNSGSGDGCSGVCRSED